MKEETKFEQGFKEYCDMFQFDEKMKQAFEEYCEEIKQTPDFRHWHHRFNVLRRYLRKIK